MKRIIVAFITVCFVITSCIDSGDVTPMGIEQLKPQEIDELMNVESDPDTLEGGNCPICPPKNP